MTASEPVTVYLGVGSNLGDREEHLQQARARLDQVPGVRVVAASASVETKAIGGIGSQPDYRNAVWRVESELSPDALLAVCQAIEREAGRQPRSERFAPRPLDLDVLLFGDRRIESPGLVVPHPRIADRPFVLDGLRELGVELSGLEGRELPVERCRTALRDRCEAVRRTGRTVGFVPTMGALHAGHASLLRAARDRCDYVVASIFVNPLQFDEAADLENYPRTFEADLAVCREAGVDLLWTPESLYEEGFASRIAVGDEAEGMEGAMRSGHFEGVATVVALLLTAVGPDLAFFGQKDAQQLAVVRRLHRDLGLRGEIVECPTVREADGLAMSSRNVRLLADHRAEAPVLHRAMVTARDAWRAGERRPAQLVHTAAEVLATVAACELEYVELRESATLAPLPDVLQDESPDAAELRMLLAARFGEIRLIDNLVFSNS